MNEPIPGATAVAELTVLSGDLASALSQQEGDAFPSVFATASMIALMEIAGARVLGPCLAQGQISVGVTVDVTHSAPTPPGAVVTATARYLGRADKLYEFEVIATDAGGEIGRARHKRAIVDIDRIQEKARRRVQAGG